MQDWVSRLRLKLNNLSPDHASVIIQKQDYPLKKTSVETRFDLEGQT